MQPIEQLLNRIKWDPEFGTGAFALGYWDRVARVEKTVPFTPGSMEAGTGTFLAVGDDGVAVRIPLHRVRSVYRNGRTIWRRRPEETSV